MVTLAKFTEADVAVAAEKWLASHGYVVYREVRDGVAGPRADLVGLRGNATHVVECKTRLSMDLIEQAHGWLGASQMVSVAVPALKRFERHPTVVLRTLGVGMLSCESLGSPYASASQSVAPRWHGLAKSKDSVRSILHEAQRVLGTAGTKRGGYYTEFRWTMEGVAEYVALHPGCTIRDVMENVDHHYASDKGARHGLAEALKRGWCPKVKAERATTNALLLYPQPEQTESRQA